MTAFAADALASQATFRAVMDAFARPGTVVTARGDDARAPLAPATAALVTALADYETPIWLDETLSQSAAVADWILFQTGARLTEDPASATFALIGNARALPDLAKFSVGTDEYPDRSTTMIAQIEAFSGRALTLQGPGIKGARSLAAEPLPDDIVERLAANRLLFPRGVDLVLVAGDRLAALPRSLLVSWES
jgi:alpha-D-ribose 1-methylphosphonate 5-triphosphate synthase subunit PhnH